MTELRTADVLLALGFADQDEGGKYRLNLQSGAIDAMELVHPRSGYIMHFSGVLSHRRSISEIDFAMPRTVESADQAKAWIAYGLKDASALTNPPEWLNGGRSLQHLLPWVQNRAKNEPRFQCVVDRELFRPLAKMLRCYVSVLDDISEVEISFRESILRIQVGPELLAIAGYGNAWDSTLIVARESLSEPQGRLYGSSVNIAVYGNKLHFGTLTVDIIDERS